MKFLLAFINRILGVSPPAPEEEIAKPAADAPDPRSNAESVTQIEDTSEYQLQPHTGPGEGLKTEIIAILDRSGSMDSIIDDAIGGFNAFLREQQSVPGEARMTIALFDDAYEVLCTGKPVSEAEPLTRQTFVPCGCTALHDAIGRTLNEQGARIKNQSWAEKVIVCILTDGRENASREFTLEQVKAKVQNAEKNDWSFIYLGANQDAFVVGSQLGISSGQTVTYNPNKNGVDDAFSKTTQSVTRMRTNRNIH